MGHRACVGEALSRGGWRRRCASRWVCPVSQEQCLTSRGGGHVCPSAAERVTSLGKDWHRPCLKCEKCGKTLTSGSHAEHEGKPYCNHPCYAAMFGPKGFGRGGAESHTFK
ncbi:cysteine-rich protein 1 isoform X1 [Monodon monoceros]|uniref:cysteine-rich protein 1 isoform X1 n=1 Tax=Monodon monoceros TaxID=40151 RepID=UPI0010F7BA5D|nr:cysteine-rich protein 1 isoform X1 [Monodon monoceros]